MDLEFLFPEAERPATTPTSIIPQRNARRSETQMPAMVPSMDMKKRLSMELYSFRVVEIVCLLL